MPSDHQSEPDELDDVEFLRRGLELGEGFQLYVVAADSLDAREELICRLAESPGLNVEIVRGDVRGGKTLVGTMVDAFQRLGDANGRTVVVLSDVDELAMDDPRLLGRFNEERNEFIRGAAGAVVVVAGSKLVDSMRRAAPDAWSVRAADLALGVDSAPPFTVLAAGRFYR
ncbi:MAG: hypothetical protein GY856_27155 [bacterium]|nr:hypothetical protein [bacterium]